MNGSSESAPRWALISVSDKRDIVDFARGLTDHGFHLLSTGGTARALEAAGLEVTAIDDFTGFPEIMGGRVKTLHPRVHGGLLGREGTDEAVMREHDIPRIELAVINLYPFESVTADPECSLETAIENIDIGGPAMVRSAAKNHTSVGIVTDPDQYPRVLAMLSDNGGRLDAAYRFELAVHAFDRIARYDAAISNYLSAIGPDGERLQFPQQATGCFEKIMDLRYGENPHQKAAWFRTAGAEPTGLAAARQLQGKELSFNNIADADAALGAVAAFDGPACVIVKHANPCGVAIAGSLRDAYGRAFETDPTSAFGGIIAFNQPLDGDTARDLMDRQFVEVVIAPDFDADAQAAFAAKPNVRLLAAPPGSGGAGPDIKRISGGILLQSADAASVDRDDCRIVTKMQPTDEQWADLLFAWKVVKSVKSNAIVFAADGQTRGIGAGQMSRVDATRIARWKAGEAGLELNGTALASDAFFPFRDGIDTAAEAGVACVIQPGGSMRDEEVIAAADEHGIAMIFTGVRHFRH
ncbi:bifunctional phosphoribosylaminoimidazolecarboxamide formyltransferase/IMP cyclohydrolase [Elongatibacter sediminis]|uniref:Bifunctional purine biosynthesis protein PurH n=1 Tax=Elongatibacter sediminis TaxID=3119006 RepID=A0AAW9R5N4_9GAMM